MPKPNRSFTVGRSNQLPPKGEILLFQTEDNKTRIEVLMHGETVWLTINEMAQLFQIHKSGISKHLKNIFETFELQRNATVANFATVQEEGKRKVVRELEYFNFLKLSGRNLLVDSGKISHTEALERAYAEYEKYRKKLENGPSPIEEHFLKVMQEVEEKAP
jgi:hypothetical protein